LFPDVGAVSLADHGLPHATILSGRENLREG
jgi:hypothetical protein